MQVDKTGRQVGVVGTAPSDAKAHANLPTGFKVTLFEKSDTVGGVWAHNYAGYALQV